VDSSFDLETFEEDGGDDVLRPCAGEVLLVDISELPTSEVVYGIDVGVVYAVGVTAEDIVAVLSSTTYALS